MMSDDRLAYVKAALNGRFSFNRSEVVNPSAQDVTGVSGSQRKSKLPYIQDARYRFPDYQRVMHASYQNETDQFEDTNDGRGATLVGVMIVSLLAFVFGLLIGMGIGRI